MYTVRQVPGNSEERRFATKAEVLEWIYQRMLSGASFADASREANERFDTSASEAPTERRRRYASGFQEGVALERTRTIEAELRKSPTDVLAEDATNSKTVSRPVSRFEVIEIEGIEKRSKKKGRKRWGKRKG